MSLFMLPSLSFICKFSTLKQSKNSSIVPKCYFQGIFFACLMKYKFYLHDLYESMKGSCSLCK